MEAISLEVMSEHICTLRINRPKALNALNQELLEELEQTLRQLALDGRVRVLIVTGEGEKAFIAGADIQAMQNMTPLQMNDFCALGQRVALALEEAPFVTIAAVNGYALGGGLEMALSCDFIYSSDGAKLGLPEVTLGLIPGFGGTQRLCRAIGNRAAKELIMTGRIISASEAHELGIVNSILPLEDLLDGCYTTAEEVLNNSFPAVIQAKEAINKGHSLPLREALDLERYMCSSGFSHPDRLEGMSAFVEKRPAQFQ